MLSYREWIYKVLFLALGLAVITSVFAQEVEEDYFGCVHKIELVEVRGNSLAPLIKAGSTIKLLYGYYNCHPVRREEIIAYKYAGNDAPIIKLVKAIPGDRWRLKRDKQQNSYRILVNDRAIKNSQGRLYQIPESKIKMLKLYVKSYPVLPENTYLLLGNRVSGSLDATRFGLIGKSAILGKVLVALKQD